MQQNLATFAIAGWASLYGLSQLVEVKSPALGEDMLGGESPGRVGQSGRALQSESIYIPKGIPQIIAERPKLMAIVWPTGHARLTERKFRDLKINI